MRSYPDLRTVLGWIVTVPVVALVLVMYCWARAV